MNSVEITACSGVYRPTYTGYKNVQFSENVLDTVMYVIIRHAIVDTGKMTCTLFHSNEDTRLPLRREVVVDELVLASSDIPPREEGEALPEYLEAHGQEAASQEERARQPLRRRGLRDNGAGLHHELGHGPGALLGPRHHGAHAFG